MVQKKVRKLIQVYKKDLEKKIKVSKVILFGSYARGKATEDSDVDLVILSKDFSKMRIDKRLDLLQRERRNPLTHDFAMDIFGYTPAELAKASPLTTLGEIKETGVEVEV